MNDTARHILIVDDDERVRTLLSWQLEAEGFTVRCTADGGEALERIDAERPDLSGSGISHRSARSSPPSAWDPSI
jgi:CheY-like chemotaxis protein